jgi:regulatory protein
VTPRKKPAAKLPFADLERFAQRSLAARPLSEGQLRTKLRAKAENPADIEAILAKLREYGALDDRQFAAQFAASRMQNRGFGAERVRQELRQRQVGAELTEQTVNELFDSAGESARIEDFLARKFRGKNLAEWLREPKNFASAFRRLRTAGYSAAGSLAVLKRQGRNVGEDFSAEEIEG